MNCEHCQELLPLRERAELTPPLQADVAAHVRECADCARAGAALHALNTLLDTEVQASPGLRRQVLARLEQEAAQHGTPLAGFGALFARLWPSRPLGAFSYSLVLVLGGMFGGQLLPGAGADMANADGQYQLCPVPAGPASGIL